ncbi:putative transcription factor B3-Domain family [Rosa chinensis]|uniref:Putative transcription factor B3-Domain family n=1 Tax=Rosa chinensis TaxID=74649 RepID=A0A2P6S6N0_ROSCH|nr:putative transcription factor B3-Domain family [Rosa chinensis]
MMMDQTHAALHSKTEAFALRAGVNEHGFLTRHDDQEVDNNNSNKKHDNNVNSFQGSDRPGSIRDLVRAVSTSGVQRKKRMMRQRRATTINFQLSFATPSSHVLPSTSPPARVTDPARLRFLFQKELKNSDVSTLRRVVLPKTTAKFGASFTHGPNDIDLFNINVGIVFQKAAEAHLPALESKEGISISMDDIDGLHVWSFKFWPNNNSRMYVLENTGEFVSTHGLQLGDFIMVYQDSANHNYAKKANSVQDNDEEDETVYGVEETMNNAVNELMIYDSLPDQANKSSSFYMPTMDHDHMQDVNAGMSFVYDTTAFSNDSLLDFLGGSMTNYSRSNGRLQENFGSVENLSLDDFY